MQQSTTNPNGLGLFIHVSGIDLLLGDDIGEQVLKNGMLSYDIDID